MKKSILILISFIYSSISFGQDWERYSDSIIANIRNNNNSKAEEFLILAEKDLSINDFKKDTIYADFLYRKGLLNFFKNQSPEIEFNEAIRIWNTSKKINPKKLIRLYFYFGEYFLANNEFEKAYENYELCHEMGLLINFESVELFESVSIHLSKIDFYIHKDENKAKFWAMKYIEFAKNNAIEQFDLNFAKAYSILGDPKTASEVLVKYLENYNAKSLDNVDLLFGVYTDLTSYYYYDDLENHKGIIKYGEQALKLKDEVSYDTKLSTKSLYSILIYSYGLIGDNINENKYKKLRSEEFSQEGDNIDYYNNLNLLLIDQDYLKFEPLFYDYEITLIKAKDFNTLFEIYSLTLQLYSNGILFNKSDIDKQISTIEENINSLTQENVVYFDAYLAEYSFFLQDYVRAIQIADNYLDFKDDAVRLGLYKIKAVSESILGIENGKTSAYKLLEIAESLYGENSPQTLPYLSLVLSLNSVGGYSQTIKEGTKALEIVYNNNLENTDIAAGIWSALGLLASQNGNLKDGEKYYKNSIVIYENYEKISNSYNYYSSLLGLSSIYFQTGSFDESIKYLDKTRKFLDGTSNMMGLANGDYYYYLGHYFFWQDKFLEARENYEKAFDIYGITMSKKKNIQLIFSDYFLNNNTDATIKKLEKYYKENGDIGNAQKILYLIKFNTNQRDEARNILISRLNKIIKDNNEYFHLLSDKEREIIYKNFTEEFEFLNTHLLLDNDSVFLNDYIHKRLYFKSLLFYNTFNKDFQQESIVYIEQLKSNQILINKYYEQQEDDYSTEIDNLQQRNRELERFLAQSKVKVETPTVDQIKNKLTDETAYVEIIRINKQSTSVTKDKLNILNTFTDSIYYGAIIIKKNKDPNFIIIDDSHELEKNHLKNYNNFINGSNKFSIDSVSYSQFFKPLEDELNGVKSIYLVTDGIYNSINPETFFNRNKGKYVIDYLNINRIISARSLMTDDSDESINNLTATLIGNPEFELNTNIKTTDDRIVIRDSDIDYLRDNQEGNPISYLPGTELEINSIEAILKKAKFEVDLFSSEEANESNLKHVQSPNILHIATHGYFLRKENDINLKKSLMGIQSSYIESNTYLKSGLYLSGAQNTLNGENTSINADNGVFTAQEAKGLDLKNTQLVVLSACETGLGDILIGDGIYGLQRAFMMAGSKSVIMSLWKVNDETTQKLMKLFYTNWIEKGMIKSLAFKEAKMEFKKDYSEPVYWAPFILIE